MPHILSLKEGIKYMIYSEKIRNPRSPWRPRKIETPEQLANQFVCYAEYVENNPIIVTKVFHTGDGRVVSADLRKHRPMTVESFCMFLGVASRTWRHWRSNREDLADMIEMIEDAIYDQLFCLAAANVVKANLVSRKLGLAQTR